MAASRVARFLARIWFRDLRCEGPTLPSGPCLILLNHPNGLLDPLAAAALLDRRAGWLAKATLWKLAPLRPFLAAFRAIPVTRPKDGGATPESIQHCFRKVHEVLARGDSVAMFPEGVSHSDADLAPLKTGAARMVLSSPVPVSLVPAGLVYGDRATFRHSVLLRLGEPVPWEDLAARGAEPEAVAELTARIRAALKPLTLHAAEVRVLALAQEVAWLLAEAPGSRVDLEILRRRVRALVPASPRGRPRNWRPWKPGSTEPRPGCGPRASGPIRWAIPIRARRSAIGCRARPSVWARQPCCCLWRCSSGPRTAWWTGPRGGSRTRATRPPP